MSVNYTSYINFSNNYILFGLVIVLILGGMNSTFTETYENMNNLLPGQYNKSGPILVKDYPIKKPMSLNTNTTNIWKEYPVFRSSYKQQTNNIKYWSTPNNGICSPAEFCGSMYSKKNIYIPPPLKPIPFTSDKIRVNYYAAIE